ncbi:MAG: hypothetical protein KJ896_01470 [Nanoarchaeota archaeon]|nr:hypothetical protein [Nanoarchaeota archaeon]
MIRTKRMNRKAQMQMMETIGVLFIFFILVLFGIIFYFKYQQIALQEKQEELVAARAMDTTLQTLFLPELQCSRGDSEPYDNCVDLAKVRAWNETMERYYEDYYFNLFSYSRIYVQEVYPGNSTWMLYDNEKVDSDGNPNWEFKEPTFFVVTLRDEMNKLVYGFGYLSVEVYS